jgi:hypothetical protein
VIEMNCAVNNLSDPANDSPEVTTEVAHMLGRSDPKPLFIFHRWRQSHTSPSGNGIQNATHSCLERRFSPGKKQVMPTSVMMIILSRSAVAT